MMYGYAGQDLPEMPITAGQYVHLIASDVAAAERRVIEAAEAWRDDYEPSLGYDMDLRDAVDRLRAARA